MYLGPGPLIYRERRRLTFVIALAFLAGFLFYLPTNVHVHGIHLSWLTGAIYALVIGLSAIAVFLYLPTMRFMVEAIAVSRLCLSLFVLAAPELGYRILSDPFVMACLVVFGGLVLSRVMHGRILKEKTRTWGERIRNFRSVSPAPVRLRGSALQFRFVGWMENSMPVRA